MHTTGLSKQHARLCFLFPFYSFRLSVPQGFFWRGNKIKWVKQSHKPVKSERHVISSKRKKRTISMPRLTATPELAIALFHLIYRIMG